MRNLILILSLTFFFTSPFLNAQDKILYQKVIQADSMNKDQIYSSARSWFASTYGKADEVIQMSDKDAGLIIGKGVFEYSYKGLSYKCYSGYVEYEIKVEIKDTRYRVQLSNFTHAVDFGNNPNCALGVLSTSEIYTDRGMSKKYHNKVWTDLKLKSDDYSKQIFSSIQNHTNKPKNSDW